MARDLPLGTSIPLGSLTLGEKLGEGGFGVVHKATLAGIDTTFAIKILDPLPFNKDVEAAKKRFLREANLLFRFRHPRIVPIYGVGEYDGKPYILMEHFPGFDLKRVRGIATPDPLIVLPFIEYIGDALAYAHGLNVVHRDIKPSNLMTIHGDARVLDFGLAGLLDPEGERFTRSSAPIAGDAFSAPELTDDAKLLDPRCDIYSLGACWFWLLTGTSPKGLNWESKLRASVSVPRAYEAVLLRCLDQADKRYSTARDLVNDVRALRQGESPAVGPADLNDDQARLLGVVVGACPTTLDSASFYVIEQEIGGRQSRLRTSLALSALLKRKFLEQNIDEDQDGNRFNVFRPLPEGTDWAERNVARIDELDRATPASAAAADSDVPF